MVIKLFKYDQMTYRGSWYTLLTAEALTNYKSISFS